MRCPRCNQDNRDEARFCFLEFLAECAVYHNMPMQPVTGKNGIREVLNLFVLADEL